MLFLAGAFFSMGVFAQANASLDLTTLNSGNIIINGSGSLQIRVNNTGPTSSIPAGRIQVQITVPPNISIPSGQTATGWTITTVNPQVANICNSGTIIPVAGVGQVILNLLGGSAAGAGSMSGQITFKTNCTAPGSLSGNNTADDAATAGYNVVAGAVCNITGATATKVSNVICFGGTTTLTVAAVTSGATGTLEYNVNGGTFQSSPTFTVPAGTYTAIVREAANTACSATATAVIVTEPTALVASGTPGTIACFGGSTTVVVSATGGTAPYTGTGSITRSAGAYSLTVTDANGCTSVVTGTLTQPTQVVATAAVTTPITTFGGTGVITVTATGGTSAYTGTGTFTRTAGAYSFPVSDANGCAVTSNSVTLGAACTIAVSAAAGTISCNGGTTTLTATATGANGAVQYSLNGGAFQSGNTFTVGAGTYTITAREVATTTCSATATPVTVSQPTAIAATAAVTTAITTAPGSTGTITVTAPGGTGAKSYVITSGTTTNTTGAASGVFTSLAAGSYTFTVTDANLCTSVTSPVILVSPAPVSADPALGQMLFTTLGNAIQSANTLLFTTAYQLNIPFYNLNQLNSVPNGTIQLRVNLGTKLSVDPAFNLATAPLSAYFTWTSAIVADSVIITGTQIATIPADFADVLVFNVRGKLSCTSNIQSKINVVNLQATLADDDLQNNAAKLQYTLPITVATTQVNVTCFGANNGILNVVTSPGVTFTVRNAANVVVGTSSPVSGLAPGVYTISSGAVSDPTLAGCTSSTSVTIFQPSLLTTSVTGTVNNNCFNASQGSINAVSSGGTAPYSYTIAGPTVNTTGAATGLFTGLLAGSYIVTVTDANGCTATSAATVITQPTGGIPDISLGSDITSSFFATPGVTQTIVYNISELNGNSAVGDTIRITKVAGFTINFNNSIFSTTVGATTYTLDNSRWKIDNSNSAFVSIILTDPSNASNPGTLFCLQKVNVAITFTRTTSNISTFTLSARLRKANGETNLTNNLNSIIMTAE